MGYSLLELWGEIHVYAVVHDPLASTRAARVRKQRTVVVVVPFGLSSQLGRGPDGSFGSYSVFCAISWLALVHVEWEQTDSQPLARISSASKKHSQSGSCLMYSKVNVADRWFLRIFFIQESESNIHIRFSRCMWGVYGCSGPRSAFLSATLLY